MGLAYAPEFGRFPLLVQMRMIVPLELSGLVHSLNEWLEMALIEIKGNPQKAEGNSNSVVSEILGINLKTVVRQRQRIMRMLNKHTTTEMVKFVFRPGLENLKNL